MIPNALSRCLLPLALASSLGAATAGAAPRWTLEYFYDQNKTTLDLVDLKFPSAKRGVAVGEILDEREKGKPVAVVTSDAGAHWAVEPLKEHPISLYFLNEGLGWMVTSKGIWQTEEAGRNWHKLPKAPSGLLRVWFTNPQRGFATGLRKAVWETADGGRTWSRLKAAEEPKTTPKYTVYDNIAFANPAIGMITGGSQPPRAGDEARLPDWIDPMGAEHRRELPHLSISLDTRDGGRTWKPSTASVFGHISRVALSPTGPSLGLLEFSNGFMYASEVFRFDWIKGGSERVFRQKKRAITDVLLAPDGQAWLAGVEVPGSMQRSPIPTAVKVLVSAAPWTQWKEIPADYRATATRVVLAQAPGGQLYLATDTGMILRFQP